MNEVPDYASLLRQGNPAIEQLDWNALLARVNAANAANGVFQASGQEARDIFLGQSSFVGQSSRGRTGRGRGRPRGSKVKREKGVPEVKVKRLGTRKSARRKPKMRELRVILERCDNMLLGELNAGFHEKVCEIVKYKLADIFIHIVFG